MTRKTWLKVLSLTMLFAMVLSACAAPVAAPAAAPADAGAAPADAAAAPEGSKVLRVAYGAEIDTLNALTSQNLTDIEITIFE